jgi:ribosomal protein S21
MANRGNGIYVAVQNNNIDKALKKFKRKIKNFNLMVDIFENEAYKKPSTKKRERKLKAVARAKYKMKEYMKSENGR